MDAYTIQLLESEGFQVIEGKWDFKYRTRIFIRHPDGRLNPTYAKMSDVPILPHGTEFDLERTAFPYDEIKNRDTAVVDERTIMASEYELSAEQQLPFYFWIGYFLISLVLLAIVVCIYYILHPPAQDPPCKTEERIIDVSDCAKIIIMPNCDSRMFDACTDTWLEPDWHIWTPPPEWLQWVVYGIVAIGGIYVAVKLLPYLMKQKKKTSSGKTPGMDSI